MQKLKPVKVKIALLRKGIKQIEIARRLGKSTTAVSRVVNGDLRSPEIESYLRELMSKRAA